jgi:hypothetical protein
MSQSVLKQVADLERASTADLQDRWRQLIGTEPPRYNREFLVKRLAYRIQELAYGGLSESTRERMNQVLEQAGLDELGGAGTGRKPAGQGHNLPVAGTRLVREWNGGRYEVTVVSGGFEYAGRRYRSLTAITKAITGTHWNGRAFFGLRPAREGRGAR